MERSHAYESVIGDRGHQLSGGQRQRVAIIRAILKHSPILVLDEATSALDTKTEQAIKIGLNRLCQGRTTIVIAHRLSTITNADRILVLDKGKVVEEGTHSELLLRNGVYYAMWNAQMQDSP